jgi:hypothetical protein
MNGRAKRWTLKRQQKDLTHVLHRSVEVAGAKQPSFAMGVYGRK